MMFELNLCVYRNCEYDQLENIYIWCKKRTLLGPVTDESLANKDKWF